MSMPTFSALQGLAVSNCTIPQPWFSSFPDSVSVLPVHVDPSTCFAIVTEKTGEGARQRTYLDGIDMLTGRFVWSFDFASSPEVYPVYPIVPSPSIPSRLYIVSDNRVAPVGCRLIRAVSYKPTTGLTPLWNRTICTTFASTTATPSLVALPIMASGTDILLAGGDNTWTTLNGETGVILHQAPVAAHLGVVYVMGDASDGRVFVLSALGNPDPWQNTVYAALSFVINPSSGQWKLLANITYEWRKWSLPGLDVFYMGAMGQILTLQEQTHPDHWVGWDMVTGKQVWEVRGDPMFTGAWNGSASSSWTFSTAGASRHPLNPQLLLIGATAKNTSWGIAGAYICQFGIFDTVTGSIITRSAVTVPQPLTKVLCLCGVVQAIDARTIVTEGGDQKGQYWRTYHATTLELLSMGPLQTKSVYDSHGYVGVTKEGASIWWSEVNTLSGSLVEPSDMADASSLLIE
jgi:hypothetical protein